MICVGIRVAAFVWGSENSLRVRVVASNLAC